jgi:hypothetical protein
VKTRAKCRGLLLQNGGLRTFLVESDSGGADTVLRGGCRL